MKKYIRYSLLAAMLLSLGTVHVRAGDEAWAALGGFVAGVITGTAIDDNNHYRGSRDEGKYGRPDYQYDRGIPHPVKYGHGPEGRWEIRKVRVWVPGHWEFSYSRHGNRIRIWESGQHVWRKSRVWVPFSGKRSRHGYRD